jgi:hypothetical protein
LLDDKAMLVEGAVEDETVVRHALSGAPDGRRLLPAMRTMLHERRRPKIGPDPTIDALDITGAWPRSANSWQW